MIFHSTLCPEFPQQPLQGRAEGLILGLSLERWVICRYSSAWIWELHTLCRAGWTKEWFISLCCVSLSVDSERLVTWHCTLKSSETDIAFNLPKLLNIFHLWSCRDWVLCSCNKVTNVSLGFLTISSYRSNSTVVTSYPESRTKRKTHSIIPSKSIFFVDNHKVKSCNSNQNESET